MCLLSVTCNEGCLWLGGGRRGVSGGERKRVSTAEVMSGQQVSKAQPTDLSSVLSLRAGGKVAAAQSNPSLAAVSL